MTNPFSHCPNARGGERDVEGNPDYEMGSFALVAGPFLGEDGDWAFPEDVHDPIIFEGDLYGITPDIESLVRWNLAGFPGNWEVMADGPTVVPGPQFPPGNMISALSVEGDGIYCGVGGAGTLWHWNFPGDKDLILIAERLLGPGAPINVLADYIYELIYYKGEVYGGSGVSDDNTGRLLKPPDALAEWDVMALTPEFMRVASMAVFQNRLFIGTAPTTGVLGGLLLRWDDIEGGVLEEVAPQFQGVPIYTYMYGVYALQEFKGELYASGSFGVLLKWNEVDDWVVLDVGSTPVNGISNMVVFEGQLYAQGRHLWIFNEDTDQLQIIAQVPPAPLPYDSEPLNGIIVYDGHLYCTGNDGFLWRLHYPF